MKRIVFVIIACMLPLLALAQEKKEMKLDLKNGTSLTGMVTIQKDGSYLLETSSGDIFFFEVSEVRKATVITQEPLSPVVLAGSDYYEGKVVYKEGSCLRLYENNEALTQKDFATYPAWERYQKAKKKAKSGANLMIWGSIGGVLAGAAGGAIVGVINEEIDEEYILAGMGGGAMLFSVPLFITGLILNISGNKQLKKMENTYNQSPGYVIDFGAQQHGVGFALKF